MKNNSTENKEHMSWHYLLSPEDTSAGGCRKFYQGKHERCAGCLKLGLWLAVAIITTIALGQL